MSETKHAKRFLWNIVILLIILIVSYTLFFLWIGNREIKISHSYKQFLLQHTKGQRLIIDSGSNSHHGINSNMIENQLGILTINLADNGSYPLRNKLLRLKKYARKGDIVLMPLEWRYYSHDLAPDVFKKNLFGSLNFYYFQDDSLIQEIKAIWNRPFSTFIKALKFQKNISKKSIVNIHNYLNRFKNKQRGEYIYKGPLPLADDGTKTLTCDQYIFFSQLKYGFKVNQIFKDNLKLIKSLEAKGIKIILTWPSVAGDDCYKSKYKKEINQLMTEIRTLLKKNNIDIIGNPYDSSFPKKYMLNTFFHLIPEARDIRTQKLINEIKKLNLSELSSIKNKKSTPYQLDINLSLTK